MGEVREGYGINSLLPLWVERWKAARIHPRDKVCFFNTVLKEDKKKLISKNSMYISKSGIHPDRIRQTYDAIYDFQPKWMLLHPSMAMLLCELIEKEKLLPIMSIQYIELTGEMVLESLINRVRNVFSCPVKCHYGSMEVSTIGYESSLNRYRLFEQSTYVEVLDDDGIVLEDGEVGNIYLTSLHNHAMPIIRYGIGDCGKIQSIEEKGGKTRYLELTRARKNTILLLPDGTKSLPDILLRPIDIINFNFGKVVYQVKIIQEKRNQLKIIFVLDDEFEKEEIIKAYQSLLDDEWTKDMVMDYQFSNAMLPE